ncbi:hypothetical protein ABPG72_020019 [Tetrahymena utriculariae]
MYWSKNELLNTPSIKDLLSFDRFTSIRRMLSYIEVIENENKISMIKRNLTIDESIIKYKGRNKLRVYMPLKPVRHGFKIYVLAESDSGYILNWQLHDGVPKSLTDIVNPLVNIYSNKGFSIYFDRFYTSFGTLQSLSDKGFQVSGGAIKTRIKLSNYLKDEIKRMIQFECKFYTSLCKTKLLTVWRDTKTLLLLSNHGDNSIEEIQRANKKDHNLNQIPCPSNLVQYQQNARGVDFIGQMLSIIIIFQQNQEDGIQKFLITSQMKQLIKKNQLKKFSEKRAYSQETSPEKTRQLEDRNDFYKSLVVQAHTTKKATKIQEKQAEKNLSTRNYCKNSHNNAGILKNNLRTELDHHVVKELEVSKEAVFNHGASAFGLEQMRKDSEDFEFQTMPAQGFSEANLLLPPPPVSPKENQTIFQKAPPSSVNKNLFDRISSLVAEQNNKNDKMITKARDHQEKIKNQHQINNQKLKMVSNFYCAKCKVPFNDLESLKKHRTTFHQGTFYEEGSSELLFTCEVCQVKSLTSKSGYETHKSSCLRSYIQMINQQAGKTVLQLKQYSEDEKELIQLAKRSLRDEE